MAEPGTVHEHTLGGYPAVTLRNARLEVTVLPTRGGEIHTLLHRASGLDLLWKPPWGLPAPRPHVAAGPASEAAWMENYGGGWQGIFPNGGDSCVYRQAHLGFHGEASTVPWEAVTERGDDHVQVRMETRLARSPFRLRRTIVLRTGAAGIEVRESVSNESGEDLHVMWGQHPALSTALLSGAEIDVAATHYVPHVPEIDLLSRAAPGQTHAWPHATGKGGEPVDLSRLPGPDRRLSEFGYLTGLAEGRYRISNRALGLGVECTWDLAEFPYLWLWLEWGAGRDWPWYGECRVGALEPFSSIPGTGLLDAIAQGSAVVLHGGETRSTTVGFAVLEELPVGESSAGWR